MPSTDDFYQQLPALTKFLKLTDDRHYRPLPGDWTVVITDVCDSTQAIEAGRYKDVNLIGAATIAAVRNVLDTLDFPFVFGGDGASFAVPNNRMEEITFAMNGLRDLALKNFDLKLRIGAVSVEALIKKGARVEIAKYDLLDERCITLFRGGGLGLAERWVKMDNSDYLLPEQLDATASMDGLSCRWNAIPSQHGEVISLLVQVCKDDSYKVYTDFLMELDDLLDGQLEAANPVNTQRSSYQSVRQCLRQERRLHRSRWSVKYWLRAAEIVCCILIFRYKVPPFVFNPKRYVDSMRVHADYRKFDDMLRMVIDLTTEQSERVANLLEQKHAEGSINYGLSRSDSSLITCFVDDVSDGKHIHFVDGSAGGYALAAKQLKAQIAARVSNAS